MNWKSKRKGWKHSDENMQSYFSPWTKHFRPLYSLAFHFGDKKISLPNDFKYFSLSGVVSLWASTAITGQSTQIQTSSRKEGTSKEELQK